MNEPRPEGVAIQIQQDLRAVGVDEDASDFGPAPASDLRMSRAELIARVNSSSSTLSRARPARGLPFTWPKFPLIRIFPSG